MSEKLTRSQMLKKLGKNTVRISFLKQSTGRLNNMTATLDPALLPSVPENLNEGNRDIITVYSTDRKDWRSVRVDSVRDFVVL